MRGRTSVPSRRRLARLLRISPWSRPIAAMRAVGRSLYSRVPVMKGRTSVRRVTQRAWPSRHYSGACFNWLCQARSKRITCRNSVNLPRREPMQSTFECKGRLPAPACSRGLLAAFQQLRGDATRWRSSFVLQHLSHLIQVLICASASEKGRVRMQQWLA